MYCWQSSIYQLKNELFKPIGSGLQYSRVVIISSQYCRTGEDFLLRSLKSFETLLGEDHLRSAEVMRNLAAFYLQCQKYAILVYYQLYVQGTYI